MYWNEYKTKSENKKTTSEYRYFLESNFVGVNRLFVLIYSNQDNNSKGTIKNYNVIINGKDFYDQYINSDWKRYGETYKLTTGQGEDYTTGCFLDYEHIKNHCKLIAVI